MVLVLVLSGNVGAVSAAMACDAPLIVMGASLVDVGENAAAEPLTSASEFPPYGVDYFGHPAARFSNGRLIIDFISQEMGYGLLDPYLDSVEPNFAGGVDFASSGSTATTSNNSGLFSLAIQVSQYKHFKAKVQQAQKKHKGSLKQLPAASQFTKAIHFIEAANNDYIHAFSQTASFNPQSLVVEVISSIEWAIRELHSEGAKNIIVTTVLPLGCTPAFLSVAAGALELNNDSCITFYNEVVDLHNSHLKQLIEVLRAELSLDGLVVFDLNAMYLDAIRNPSKYRVKHRFKACCGAGGGKYNMDASVPCGSKKEVNGQLLQAGRCSFPPDYISWDGLHVTETFAEHLAYGVLSGRYLKPSLSIKDICKAAGH